MSYRLNIRPEAEADVMEAALWYEQRKPGLGEEFITEVDQAIRQVRENPRTDQIRHRSVFPGRACPKMNHRFRPAVLC
jgi:hypothetical protein